jgi:TRAP-type C4-dicarboxylate transport system permease small subunit
MAAESADQVSPPSAPPLFAMAARVVRMLAWAQLTIAGVLLVEGMCVNGAEIVMRSFINTSYPDYYEVVGISFIYVFLFSAAALYARDEDIVIGMLYDFAPRAAKPWWVLTVHLLVAATMVLVFVYTIQLIGLQSRTPTPLLGVPESVKWWPLAVASASITFTSLVEAWSCGYWIRDGIRPKTWPYPLFDHDSAEEAVI